MRQTLELARIALFALFLAAPVLTLLALGPAQEYGFHFTPFPSLGSFLGDAPDARKRFGNAILDRSYLKRDAISVRNRIAYSGFGYLDEADVVSGVDDWLFYKGQFFNGKCLSEAEITRTLAHLDAVTDVAAAAGLRFVPAIAPDKSMVYPEKLARRARAYWGCKLESGALWRRIAAAEVPGLVDLTGPLIAAKATFPDTQIYYTTDTHWTRLGAAVGRRRLLTAMAARDLDLPPPKAIPDAAPVWDGLGRMMLLGPSSDPGTSIDPGPEAIVASTAATLALGRLVFFHDSFVELWPDDFKADLPGTYLDLNYNPAESDIWPALESADTVLLLSVERNLLYVGGRTFGWKAPFGRSLIRRNEAAAAGCTFSPAEATGITEEPPPKQRGGKASAAKKRALTKHVYRVAIPATATGAPCIALATNLPGTTTLTIGLPAKDGSPDGPPFPPGRAIEIAVSADNPEVRLVLPAYVAGKAVRIGVSRPSRGDAFSSIRVGARPDRPGN